MALLTKSRLPLYNKIEFIQLNCTINSTLTHVKMTFCLQQAPTSQIILQGKGYDSFINAIKSPKTKIAYVQSLRRYLNHRKMTEVDNLLLDQNPRLIESQIVDYVMTLRSEGIAYTTIQFLIAPVLTFYSLNDVVLNKRKISRYFGEYKRRVKDRAYTSEEIWKALQIADQRMKVIILMLTSTGQRIGSLGDITLISRKLRNLAYIELQFTRELIMNIIAILLGSAQLL